MPRQMIEYNTFEELLGTTIVAIENKNDEELVIMLDDGREAHLWHEQDCCESVTIEDIAGNLDDLLNSPILLAEEMSSNDDLDGVNIEHQDDSFTWTFYKLATNRGAVTIRWYGESNGYYSESVAFRISKGACDA